MISFMGKKIGVEVDEKSFFNSIFYNGFEVGEIRVNNNIVAFATTLPPILEVLKQQGCVMVGEIYKNYPIIEKCVSGTAGLFFPEAGNVYFDTETTPSYTDTLSADIKFSNISANAKTIWCTRAGSNNACCLFIVNANPRFDFGSKSGSVSQFPSLVTGVTYTLTQNPSGGIMSVNDNIQTTAVTEYSPVSPITLGSSYETYRKPMTLSNKLTNAMFYHFSLKGDDNMYKRYLVGIENNKMIDLVTGTVYTNLGTGDAVLTEED